MTEAEVLEDLELLMRSFMAFVRGSPSPTARDLAYAAVAYARLVAEWRALKRGRRGNGTTEVKT